MCKRELILSLFSTDVKKYPNDEAILFLLSKTQMAMTTKTIQEFLNIFGLELQETHVSRILRKLKERNYVELKTVQRACYYSIKLSEGK